MTHKEWMQEALSEAYLANQEQEVPVGAVIVKNNVVVSRAHNRCSRENDPTAHAEMLVLKEAYRKFGTLERCTLYVTLEPCAMCAGAMLHLHLPRLVFGTFDPLCGCCGSRIDLTDHWFDQSIETIGGICEEECSFLLKDFFKDRRNK